MKFSTIIAHSSERTISQFLQFWLRPKVMESLSWIIQFFSFSTKIWKETVIRFVRSKHLCKFFHFSFSSQKYYLLLWGYFCDANSIPHQKTSTAILYLVPPYFSNKSRVEEKLMKKLTPQATLKVISIRIWNSREVKSVRAEILCLLFLNGHLKNSG